MFKYFVLSSIIFCSLQSFAMEKTPEQSEEKDAGFNLLVMYSDYPKLGSLGSIKLSVNKSMTVKEVIAAIKSKMGLMPFVDIKVSHPPFGGDFSIDDERTLERCGIDRNRMLKVSISSSRRY